MSCPPLVVKFCGEVWKPGPGSADVPPCRFSAALDEPTCSWAGRVGYRQSCVFRYLSLSLHRPHMRRSKRITTMALITRSHGQFQSAAFLVPRDSGSDAPEAVSKLPWLANGITRIL